MRHLLLLLALAATPALAGTRATYAGEDGKVVVIEVADDGDARIGGLGAADYGVMRGGHFHVVGTSGGQPTVARIEDVATAMERVLPPPFRGLLSAAPAPTLKIVADGRETIAGREGARYKVTGAGPAERLLVVSDDAALKPVGAALEGFTTAAILPMAALLGPAAGAMVAEVRALFALGTPLATPNGMRLVKVETADVPADRVRLPAAPLSVEALAAAMRGAGER